MLFNKHVRAGAKTLSLLGAPRIAGILHALAAGPQGRRTLHSAADWPPQSTLRNLLVQLEKNGVVTKKRQEVFPNGLEYTLTDSGRDLLAVAASLELWLSAAPDVPIEIGGNRAKAAVKGLVEGWSAAILSALSTGPLSLTELDKLVTDSSYPTIERALGTMRLAGQLDIGPRTPRGTPYVLNEWVRSAFIPLCLAARWEFRHRPIDSTPIQRIDLESACAIVSPLLTLPANLVGVCRVTTALTDEEGQSRRATAAVEVGGGQLSFAPASPDRKAGASASGSVEAWFSTLLDGRRGDLRVRGKRTLADGILDRVHRSLFAADEGILGQLPAEAPAK